MKLSEIKIQHEQLVDQAVRVDDDGLNSAKGLTYRPYVLRAYERPKSYGVLSFSRLQALEAKLYEFGGQNNADDMDNK